jgi:hypothetical protein
MCVLSVPVPAAAAVPAPPWLRVLASSVGCGRVWRASALPLTGERVVDRIITELGVFDVVEGTGLVMLEIAPGVTEEEVQAKTGCKVTLVSCTGSSCCRHRRHRRHRRHAIVPPPPPLIIV